MSELLTAFEANRLYIEIGVVFLASIVGFLYGRRGNVRGPAVQLVRIGNDIKKSLASIAKSAKNEQ